MDILRKNNPYLHLTLLCGGLTQGQLEGQDGHGGPGQGGGVPGAFTGDAPGRRGVMVRGRLDGTENPDSSVISLLITLTSV